MEIREIILIFVHIKGTYLRNKLKDIKMENINTTQDINFNHLFDENGNPTGTYDQYFTKNGDLVDELYFNIDKVYKNYPADSIIVAMHYANLFADETHGNYNAEILLHRAISNISYKK